MGCWRGWNRAHTQGLIVCHPRLIVTLLGPEYGGHAALAELADDTEVPDLFRGGVGGDWRGLGVWHRAAKGQAYSIGAVAVKAGLTGRGLLPPTGREMETPVGTAVGMARGGGLLGPGPTAAGP